MRGVWTLIWIWSLSQQKESWFLKQFAYPWRVELHICGAWATISSLKRVISRLQVLDWLYCKYHQVFVNGRSLHLTLGVAHCFTLIWVVSVAHFPGHLFLTAQNHGAECSLSCSLPRPSHFIVRDNCRRPYRTISIDMVRYGRRHAPPNRQHICSHIFITRIQIELCSITNHN